jgi:hypothetical protein
MRSCGRPRETVGWARLRRRELEAPWKPVLADGMDVSYFDEYDEKDSVKPFADNDPWADTF